MDTSSDQRAQNLDVQTQPPPPRGEPRPAPSAAPPPPNAARASRHRDLPRWRGGTMLWIGALAVLTNFSLRLTSPGLVVTVLGLATVGLLGRCGRLETRLQQLASALIGSLSILFSLRSSAWVTTFSVMAIAALVVLAASDGLRVAKRHPWLGATQAIGQAMGDTGPWLRQGWRMLSIRSAGTLTPWVRSLAVGLLTTSVLVALLASADPAFGWLVSSANVGSWIGHLATTAILALPAAVLVLLSARGHDGSGLDLPPRGRGQLEARVAIWSVATTLTVWCGLQIAVISGGAESVLAAQDITPAEYARQGFFQLVAVAAISLSVLNGAYRLGRTASGGDTAQRLPAFVIGSALSVLIIVTYSRLGFYVDAFGMTMLRLSVATFLGWLALMTVLSVVRSLGCAEGQHWLPATSILSAAVLTLAFGLVNPEAQVARINLERSSIGEPVDGLYFLQQLSDDAKPVAAAFDWESVGGRSQSVDSWLCRSERRSYGPLGWNLSSWDLPDGCET